jgi:hypothetical protein
VEENISLLIKSYSFLKNKKKERKAFQSVSQQGISQSEKF